MTPNASFENPKTMARDAHFRTKPFSGRQMVWRSLRAVVLILLLIEAVWLVAANLLLLPHGAVSRWVNLKPEKIRMEWSEAKSFWPGDLRVRNFQIRGNHLTTQWALSLDTARTQVGLGALFDKCFLGRGLVAEGAVFHLRRLPKVTAQLDKQLVVASIPWAEWTTRPLDEEVKAILAAQVRPPAKRIWAVNLPGVRLNEVREIWFDEFRYRGGGTTRGSLFVRPRELLDVKDARVEVGPGTVTLGTDEVLTIHSGRMDLAFPQVNTVIFRGGAAFQKMDGKFRLEGTAPDIRFVNFYLDRFPGLNLRGSPGELGVDLAIHEGVVHGETELGGKDVHINYRDVALRGDLRLQGKIRRYTFGDKEMDITGTRGVVTNVTMEVAGRRNSLPAGWEGEAMVAEGHLKLGENHRLDARFAGRIQDSRPLLALFREHQGKDLPLLLRSVLSDRDLAIRASVRSGGGVAEIDSLEVTGDRLHLLARLLFERDLPPRGILYLKRGILSIGLETGGDHTVKIRNSRQWFDEHSSLQPRAR